MPIVVRCPTGHLLQVAERHAGREIRCPKCQGTTVVPPLAAPPQVEIEPKGGDDSTGNAKPPPLPPPLPARAPDAVPPPMAIELGGPDAPLAAALESAVSPPTPQLRRRGYQADVAHKQTVYWLAAGLLLLALFQAAPVVRHGNLGAAPDWARWALLIALVELAYVAWMATLPDWSTAWVAMMLCAAVAALYALALGAAVVTPRGRSVLFEMDDVRDAARYWCSAVILLTFLLAYACGHAAVSWRRRLGAVRPR